MIVVDKAPPEIGWRSAHTATRAAARKAGRVVEGHPWTPCAHCGQQGRIYVSDGVGGLVSGLCPWCLGVGATIARGDIA